MVDILYKEECYRIQGAVFEVYNAMGTGFLESVYHECLERELSQRGIQFISKPSLTINYKSVPLASRFIPDFVCDQKIILEIKAQTNLHKSVEAQMIHYLKATGLRLGLLVNFGDPDRAAIRRFIH